MPNTLAKRRIEAVRRTTPRFHTTVDWDLIGRVLAEKERRRMLPLEDGR